jgi:hypothetical protein
VASLATNPLFYCLHQAISIGYGFSLGAWLWLWTAQEFLGINPRKQFCDDPVEEPLPVRLLTGDLVMTTFVVGTQLHLNEEGHLDV